MYFDIQVYPTVGVLTRITYQKINFLKKGHSTQVSKIPSITNLKKPACASKWGSQTNRGSLSILELTNKTGCTKRRGSPPNQSSFIGWQGWVETLTFKVHICILRKPQNFAKSPPYFSLALHRAKVRWSFHKILWPSQNI